MFTPVRNLFLGLATLVAAGAVPDAVQAAWLGYTNDTREALVVQISAVINNQERLGQPRSINPRERNFEPIVQPGVRLLYINVFTPQQRLVGRVPIQFVGRDVFYSIQIDPVATQRDKKLTLRVLEVRLPVAPAFGAPGFGPPAGAPGFMPGFMPGFPVPPPGFQPLVPGAKPQPGAVPQPGNTPSLPAPPPLGNTTAPINPKK